MRDLVLVITNNNYADEFDTQGFAIFEKRVWEEHLALAKKEFKKDNSYFSVQIGTNEDIEFEDIRSYLSQFTVKVITEKDYKLLNSLFEIEVQDVIDWSVEGFGLLTLLTDLDEDRD